MMGGLFWPLLMFLPVFVVIAQWLETADKYSGLIALALPVLGGLGLWSYQWWLKTNPFKMAVFLRGAEGILPSDEDSIKVIQADESGFPTKLTLRITPRILRTLGAINVKFVQPDWLFWRWKDSRYWDSRPGEIVSINGLRDPQVEDDHKKTGQGQLRVAADEAGGYDGWYDPPLSKSKGAPIWLEVTLRVRVQREWVGYISFQHRAGDAERSYARQKLTFKPR